jgi:hypothetical protein
MYNNGARFGSEAVGIKKEFTIGRFIKKFTIGACNRNSSIKQFDLQS